MADFISIIGQKKSLHSIQGASSEDITKAEEALGLKFAKDYADYLKKYGVVSFFGHELTGICSASRLNVINVTNELRQYTQDIPNDLYVVEETNYDGLVVWQDNSGAVYETIPGSGIKKVASGLAEYYQNS